MTRISAASLLLFFAFSTSCGKADSEPAARAENTLAACSDGVDNDGDGWIDCDDQDCQIFVMCVSTPDGGGSDTAEDVSDTHDDATDAVDGSDEPETSDADTGDDDTDDRTDGNDDTEDIDTSELNDTSDAADADADGAATEGACDRALYCIESTITLTTNAEEINGSLSTGALVQRLSDQRHEGSLSTGALVPLIGEPLQIAIGCDISATGLRGFYYDLHDGITRWVECEVIATERVSGEPAALVDSIVASLEDAEVTIEFEASAFWDSRFGRLSAIRLVDGAGFSIEWGSFPLELDESGEGVPELTEFDDGATYVFVRRFVDDELVDYASGNALLSLTRTAT